MKEHFTKSTFAAQFWCPRCQRSTMHRVDDGRRGPCLTCIKLLEEKHQALQKSVRKWFTEQLEMFK